MWNLPGAQICSGRWALEINNWNKKLFYRSQLKHSSHFCQSHGANRWEFLFIPSGRVEHKALSFCFGRTLIFMMTIILYHQGFLGCLCSWLWVWGFLRGRRGIVLGGLGGLFCSGGRRHATFYCYPSHPLVWGIFFNSLLTATSRNTTLVNLSTECEHQFSPIKLKLKRS